MKFWILASIGDCVYRKPSSTSLTLARGSWKAGIWNSYAATTLFTQLLKGPLTHDSGHLVSLPATRYYLLPRP